MLFRFSGGNYPDDIVIPLDEDHDHTSALQYANAYPSVLAIIFSGIKRHEHWIIEHLWNVVEINVMFSDVLNVFFIVPLELHKQSVHTYRTYVKGISLYV